MSKLSKFICYLIILWNISSIFSNFNINIRTTLSSKIFRLERSPFRWRFVLAGMLLPRHKQWNRSLHWHSYRQNMIFFGNLPCPAESPGFLVRSFHQRLAPRKNPRIPQQDRLPHSIDHGWIYSKGIEDQYQHVNFNLFDIFTLWNIQRFVKITPSIPGHSQTFCQRLLIVSPRPRSQTRPRLENKPLKVRLTHGRYSMEWNTGRSDTLAEQGDLAGVATKLANVSLDPFQGLELIQKTHVAC